MKNLTNELVNYPDLDLFSSAKSMEQSTPLMDLIENCYKKHGRVNIIDIGGNQSYWNGLLENLLRKRNIHITIVNRSDFCQIKANEGFSFVEVDNYDLTFCKNKEFHIAHSTSEVIHLDNWASIVKFARESNRVAEKSFIQIPSYWFPEKLNWMTRIFHQLPKTLRIWLTQNIDFRDFDMLP